MPENISRMNAEEVSDPSPDEQKIVERIYAAVMEQRLPPSTKLSEATLCESFGVGRMRVRRALLLLASQGIVDLHSNRGAFVARPGKKEARDVFDARMMLEPNIVRQVVDLADKADMQTLERHNALEQEAKSSGNRRDAIRLSGEFHVKLVAATGNAVLTRMVRELVTRTSLIIGLFGTSGVSSCQQDEHREIVDAIRDKDKDRAASMVRSHLAHIEADLDLLTNETGEPDILSILSPD